MQPIHSTRRTLLKSIGGAAILGVGGVGSAAARGGQGERMGASGDQTIVDIAAGNENFEILVQAVQKAGLGDALSGDDQLTVFAPTDEAFMELLDATPYDTLDDIPVDFLTSILLYHVTEGRRYASSVIQAPSVETLNGEDIQVDGATLNDGQAEIVATNIEASNGVIHVIDGVLLP